MRACPECGMEHTDRDHWLCSSCRRTVRSNRRQWNARVPSAVHIRGCADWPEAQLDRKAFAELLEQGWLPPGLVVENRGHLCRVVGEEFAEQRLEAIG